nr:hypothetical protein [Tanacetum cinerariifolium]
MAKEQAIVYAPQWRNMTVDNVTFQTNNNYLMEFWRTNVAYNPFPSIDETKQRPLREFLIKFLVLNRQRPFTLDFNTFCSSTGLDYKNEGLSVSTSFFGKKKKVKSQTMTPTLPKSQVPKALELFPQNRKKPRYSGRNVQPVNKGLPSMASNECTAKTMLCLEGPLGDKDSEGNKPPADMKPINPIIIDPSGTGVEYKMDKTQSTRLRVNLLKALNRVTETLKVVQDAVKDNPALNKKGENDTQVDTKEPLSYIEEEHVAMEDEKAEEEPTREVALIESSLKPPLTGAILEIHVPQRDRKAIASDDHPKVQTKLVPASKEVCLDPDAPILLPYEINRKIFQLTKEQI